MFVPNLYPNENLDEMLAFITQHSFGILVSQNKEAVTIASHIILELEKRQDENSLAISNALKKV